MTKAKTTIWICLYAVLIVLTMGIGIFALSSSEISSNAGVYYTATNPVISKEKFQTAFLDFKDDVRGGITTIIFDYYHEDEAFYSPDGGETKIDFRTINESCKRDVSEALDGSIIAYRYENGMYVISSNTITMPKDSSMFFCMLEDRTTVDVISSSSPSEFKDVETLLLRNIDTSKVESMYYFFFRLISLKELDISKIDTSSVTKMQFMFASCESLPEIDISHFNTSKAKYARYMFHSCRAAVNINISGLDLSNVTTASYGLRYMFYHCVKLETINMTGIKTKGVTDFTGMFINCTQLTSIIGLKDMDTSAAKSTAAMFHGCVNMESLDLSNFDTSNVTDMHQMFYNCPKLQILNISSFNTEKVQNMAYMFCGNVKLSKIIVGSGWTTKNLLEGEVSTISFQEKPSDHSMFSRCLLLPNWNENKVEGAEVVDKTYAYAGYNSTTKKYGYLTLKNS